MSDGTEPLEDDDASRRGQVLHAVLAGKPRSEAERDGGYELTLFDEEALARAEAFRDSTPDGDWWLVGTELRLGPLPLEGLARELWPFGTLDRLLINAATHHEATEAIVIDWKFLFHELDEAMAAPQMALYAAAVLIEPTLRNVRSVRVQVYDAGHDELFEPPAPITRKDLGTILARTKAVIEASEGEPLLLNPQPRVCSRCQGAYRCPAARATMEVTSDVIGRLDPSTMDPAMRTAFVEKAILARDVATHFLKWAADLEQKERGSFPGYKLRSKRGRKISKAWAAWHVAKRFMSLEEFLARCTVRVGQLEDFLARLWKHEKGTGTLKDGRDRFAVVFERHIEREEPAYWLVPSYGRMEVRDGRQEAIDPPEEPEPEEEGSPPGG